MRCGRLVEATEQAQAALHCPWHGPAQPRVHCPMRPIRDCFQQDNPSTGWFQFDCLGFPPAVSFDTSQRVSARWKQFWGAYRPCRDIITIRGSTPESGIERSKPPLIVRRASTSSADVSKRSTAWCFMHSLENVSLSRKIPDLENVSCTTVCTVCNLRNDSLGNARD